MTNNVDFDERVERFLKGQMTKEEEAGFKLEMEQDPELLDRAKTIALAIKEMATLNKEQDQKVKERIKSMSEEDYLALSGIKKSMMDFDERVVCFLKKQMTDIEEKKFIREILSNEESKRRAITTALMIKQMDSLLSADSEKIISELQHLDKESFTDFMTQYRKENGKRKSRAATTSDFHPTVTTTDTISTRKNAFARTFVKYAIAACFIGVIAFGGFKYHQYSETVDLGKDYYSVVPSESLYLRGDADELTELMPLLENVKSDKELRNTAKELERIYKIAIAEEYNDYSNYANIIGWNCAIAYLKAGKRKDAVRILENIVNENPDKGIADQAAKLIEKIKKI